MRTGRFGAAPRAALGLAMEAWARAPMRRSDHCTGDPDGLLVSLTTYPARSQTVDLTIRSILKGRAKPARIVVVLSEDQYPDGPPENITTLAARGVEVLMDAGDIRSYKKLLPVRRAWPDATVITADDDVFYRPDWLRRFERARRAYPREVLGLRGNVVGDAGAGATPYQDWAEATPDSPQARVVLKGVGGILYPPGALPEAVHDIELARKLTPTADDLWFKAMTLLGGTPTRRITRDPFQTPPVRGSQASSLRDINVDGGANDTQFRAVMDHFDLWARMALSRTASDA